MDSAPLLMDQEAKALDAAKRGDQHELRDYLDHFDADVNLRDDETQGTLLHVRLSSYGRFIPYSRSVIIAIGKDEIMIALSSIAMYVLLWSWTPFA